MNVFINLLTEVAPLYLIIFLGFIAGKFLGVCGKNTSVLLFYIVTPIVVLSNISHIRFSSNLLFLPIIIFCISFIFGQIFLYIGKKIWSDSRANVLSLSVSTANTGYFGIPIAMLFFDKETVGIYILSWIGMTFYESTVGFYITSKGKHTAKEAIAKIKKLPIIYACITGILLSLTETKIPPFFDNFIDNMSGAYVILGMMIIGFGIANLQKFEFDYKFITASFVAKFILWPLFMTGLIAIDNHFVHFYTTNIHQAMILLSIVPLAANSVVIATLLDAHPNEVATTVLASTIFSLIYLPIMSIFLLQ